MSDDYTKDFIDDVSQDVGGKQPADVAREVEKHLAIKAYIDRATEGLAGKQKADVARELKSHILDSADALAAEKNVPVDDGIIKAVLEKMGPAEKIAAMYPTKKSVLDHGMGKALVTLAGIAVAFLLVGFLLWLVAPDTMNLTLPGDHGQSVLQVILSVVSALALAIVVIAAIFLAIYIYESRLKTPYEARLKAFERSLNNSASPINVAARIIAILVWLCLLNLYWTRVPFIQSFGDNAGVLVPLLTDKFAQFVLAMNAMGIAGIAIALAYLAVPQKWVPALLEALLSLGNAVLFLWILTAFPFNDALSPGVATLIRVLLVVIVIGCLVSTAKQVWQAIRFALFGRPGKSNAV